MIPDRDDVHDAALYIQAFVINVFGSLENLAWIWVSERELKRPDGSDLPGSWVGLRAGNSFVRSSFSNEFHEYLETLDPWFDNLVDFRDALAHRIPLYIPPYVITPAQEAEYSELENQIGVILKEGKFEEYDALAEKQKALGKFQPEMTHSLFSGTRRIVFHPQLLADFNTVYEIADKMLAELDT